MKKQVVAIDRKSQAYSIMKLVLIKIDYDLKS